MLTNGEYIYAVSKSQVSWQLSGSPSAVGPRTKADAEWEWVCIAPLHHRDFVHKTWTRHMRTHKHTRSGPADPACAHPHTGFWFGRLADRGISNSKAEEFLSEWY